MCGIAGLWAPELSSDARRQHVERMLGCLVHRGPDGDALWNGPGITLGLARLAIVAPHLPARTAENETATVHAVVNGEIYNHRELRRGLEARGHRFTSGPDTTVIPHLYEEHGPRFPEVMDGMFAVALWDASERRLVLDVRGLRHTSSAAQRHFGPADRGLRVAAARLERAPSYGEQEGPPEARRIKAAEPLARVGGPRDVPQETRVAAAAHPLVDVAVHERGA